MFAYTVYGLSIASDIELPELVLAPQGVDSSDVSDTAVHIGVDPIDFSDRAATDAETVAWARPDDVCVRYPGLAAYRVTDGRMIRVFVAEGADASLVRLFLLGPALAVLLHQRKWLVLHASGVSVNGRAAVFVGSKGYGKSTLAAALLARGHRLIADDLVPVDFTDPGHPVVHPGFPQLKLAPATAEHLGHQSAALPGRQGTSSIHRRHCPGSSCLEPATVNRAYRSALNSDSSNSSAILTSPHCCSRQEKRPRIFRRSSPLLHTFR